MSKNRDKLDPKDEQEGHFWGLLLYAVTAGLGCRGGGHAVGGVRALTNVLSPVRWIVPRGP